MESRDSGQRTSMSEISEIENPFLSFDLLYEVLSRVDAVTLAKASCVNSQFRSVCEGEHFWKRLCNSRWPATKQRAAHDVISQTGGYRQFCARCHPCLSGTSTSSSSAVDQDASQSYKNKSWRIPLKAEDDSEGTCPSQFVSIIDIMYSGQPMFSKVIAGFPGLEEFEWFESCPFQFDVLEFPDEIDGVRKDEEGITSIALGTLVECTPYAEERKVGNLWKALNTNMTVSWILVNKLTGQMANLASCKAVGGRRQWPCEDEFILHFGTIVPSFPWDRVHCNVALKARYSTLDCKPSISIIEVGMNLENLEGARLYGMESVELLGRALSCTRTVSHAALMESYQDFHVQRLARREEKIQMENRRELIAALVSGVCAVVCLSYLLL